MERKTDANRTAVHLIMRNRLPGTNETLFPCASYPCLSDRVRKTSRSEAGARKKVICEKEKKEGKKQGRVSGVKLVR